ncbi:MAG: hypothetical protein P4M07_10610 [Xanthobacteraceae bacterium]|nr:hypothetical protein [Xanthobacteraceae bacterium]
MTGVLAKELVWRPKAWGMLALMLGAGLTQAARADSVLRPDDEIETKYVFGFTTGSGIGLEGEKEVETNTKMSFGKRDGRYGASETQFEYETTPTQFIQIEFGALGATHNISGVTGLDDRNQVALGGVFGEFRYLAVERTDTWPLAVTLSFEPNWRRIDETSGARVTNFEYETLVNADLEVVKNKVYAGFNLLYEPETTAAAGTDFAREATFGASAALAFRIHPDVMIGGEVWYLRHYDSIGWSDYTGDAVMIGPTVFVQLTRKAFIAAAWNTQVAGHEVSNGVTNPAPFNLAEFQRNRAKLRLGIEF